jgi:hypothetical protein
VGGVRSFGEADDGPAAAVTMRDVRCAMVNLDRARVWREKRNRIPSCRPSTLN